MADVRNVMANYKEPTTSNRVSVVEITKRLSIGKTAVYQMLEEGIIPGIRVGRRWIVTRLAYEKWESTCGMATPQTPTTSPVVVDTNSEFVTQSGRVQ